MEFVQLLERPSLRNPVLIGAFAGWTDAAACATTAVRLLIDQWHAQKFADIDPEEFYDFSINRPRVRLDDDMNRQLDWPANEFYYHISPSEPRDFILFVGQDPSLKWRTFSSCITALARDFGVTEVVLLGTMISDIIHTMPVSLSGYSNDTETRDRMRLLNIGQTRYQGPTGIVGALTDGCTKDSLKALSIMGQVPQYIPTTPNPKVVASLLRHVRDLLRLDLDLHDLEIATRRFEEQVSEAVSTNAQLREYIRERETRGDDDAEVPEAEPTEDFPSGETVVRSLEDFLRQNRQQRPPDA